MKVKRTTPTVQIGSVLMGGEHQVVVQSMTNTDTSDIESTVAQVVELAEAGSQVVRMTVNDDAAARAVPEIKKQVTEQLGDKAPPLVGDFHFNGNHLLKKFPECAKALDKYRINPGNADDTNFREMVEIAIEHDKVVRIGVNGGSLDQKVLDRLMDLNGMSPNPVSAEDIFVEAMVESALNSAKLAESYGLGKDQIVISGKVSEVQQMVAVYERLAEKSDYVLHLGLTEAGGGDYGMISSSVALGILLQQGIGDTVRVSLTPTPGVPRSKEVQVCQSILQSLDLQRFKPKVTSCPGCGRTTSTYFQELALKVNKKIDQKMTEWKEQYPGVENLKIAVMGCVVNGPGESKYSDIAISLPGKMEQPMAPVYIDGKIHSNLKGDHIDDEFLALLDQYIVEKYG